MKGLILPRKLSTFTFNSQNISDHFPGAGAKLNWVQTIVHCGGLGKVQTEGGFPSVSYMAITSELSVMTPDFFMKFFMENRCCSHIR